MPIILVSSSWHRAGLSNQHGITLLPFRQVSKGQIMRHMENLGILSELPSQKQTGEIFEGRSSFRYIVGIFENSVESLGNKYD